MRILVGYDGSVHSDGSLYDLAWAGLPERLDAVVLNAVVPWTPYGPGGDPSRGPWTSADMDGAREYTRQALEEAGEIAERGARFLRREHPEWNIKSESAADDAAQALVARAEAWQADLVAIASHGHSPIARFLLGSVSRKVLDHASCSVRLARPGISRRFAPAPLLLLAMDGSAGAALALEAMAARDWPKGTEARVVAVVDPRLAAFTAEGSRGSSGEGVPPIDWLETQVEAACSRLSAAGLRAVPAILAGDPRRVLLREAKESGVQAIFLGARGQSPSGRWSLGSVASALASHAPCTVEVTRLGQRV